jgi:hypothetical protein
MAIPAVIAVLLRRLACCNTDLCGSAANIAALCAVPFCARYAASDANCGEARADGVPLLCFNAVHACMFAQAPSTSRLKLALRQPCAQHLAQAVAKPARGDETLA